MANVPDIPAHRMKFFIVEERTKPGMIECFNVGSEEVGKILE
jgi:hypothetical protein